MNGHYIPYIDMSPRGGAPVVSRPRRPNTWQQRSAKRGPAGRALSLQSTLPTPLLETREESTDNIDGVSGPSPPISAESIDTLESPARPRSISTSPFHTPDGSHFNDSIERVDSTALLAYYDTPSVGTFPSFDVYRLREESEGKQMAAVRQACQDIDDVRKRDCEFECMSECVSVCVCVCVCVCM